MHGYDFWLNDPLIWSFSWNMQIEQIWIIVCHISTWVWIGWLWTNLLEQFLVLARVLPFFGYQYVVYLCKPMSHMNAPSLADLLYDHMFWDEKWWMHTFYILCLYIYIYIEIVELIASPSIVKWEEMINCVMVKLFIKLIMQVLDKIN